MFCVFVFLSVFFRIFGISLILHTSTFFSFSCFFAFFCLGLYSYGSMFLHSLHLVLLFFLPFIWLVYVLFFFIELYLSHADLQKRVLRKSARPRTDLIYLICLTGGSYGSSRAVCERLCRTCTAQNSALETCVLNHGAKSCRS